MVTDLHKILEGQSLLCVIIICASMFTLQLCTLSNVYHIFEKIPLVSLELNSETLEEKTLKNAVVFKFIELISV